MLIQKIGISNTGPIREPIELEFDPHVNVLIGPNSCGKSTVLNVLRQAKSGVDLDDERVNVHDNMWHQQEVISWPRAFASFVLISDGIDYVMDIEGVERLETDGYQPCSAVPMVFVPSIRLTFPPPEQVMAEYTFEDAFLDTRNILDFRGVFRMQDEYERLIERAIEEGTGYVNRPNQLDVNTVSAGMILAEQLSISDESEAEHIWAENTIQRSWDPGDIYARKQAVIAAADRCSRAICREIIRDESAATYEYKPPEGHELRGVTGVRYDHWSVSTNDATDEPLTIGDLSSGTQGPLMWIRYVSLLVHLQFIVSTGADKTAYFRHRSQRELHHFTEDIRQASRGHVPDGNNIPELWNLVLDSGASEIVDSHDGWRNLPFVLLIDEIENHLHPTWQRRIIPLLREYFPNAQIFATTHSPFVVAGLRAGQVHLLNRDENGVVRASTNSEDIVGWTSDEILRGMMGVDDPTDGETAGNSAELRGLRDEGLRADEREEEERQARMQELRRLVDRDLLAGGPKARRREEFAARFLEAINRRRLEEEMSQDGA